MRILRPQLRPRGQEPAGAEVTRETGVAVHNVENQANVCILTAYDATGEEVAQELQEFSPGEQKALFVSQAFTDLASAAGTMKIGCTLPVDFAIVKVTRIGGE